MSEGIGSAETPGLRTVAILVWHHHCTGDGREAWAAMLGTEAEQSRRVEWFRTELRQIIGERDDIKFRISGGCVEAEVEDLRFVVLDYSFSQAGEWSPLIRLLGRCPSCGAETVSEPLYNLAGLGRMLARFEPVSEHFCLSRRPSGVR